MSEPTNQTLQQAAEEHVDDYVTKELAPYNIRYKEAGRKDYTAGFIAGANWKEQQGDDNKHPVWVNQLRDVRDAFQWTFDKMGTPHTADHFNIPANGIQLLDSIIEGGTPTAGDKEAKMREQRF